MLYRDIKFFNGRASDSMEALPTITGATFSQKEKGYAIETGQGKYIQYDKVLLPANAFSVVVWGRLKNGHIIGTNIANALGSTTNGLRGCILSVNGVSGKTNLTMANNNYRYFEYIPDFKFHCFIFTITGSGQTDINNAQLFVDTVSQSVNSTASSVVQDPRSGFTYAGGGSGAGGSLISRIKVYDTVLTQIEIDLEQAEFERAKIISRANSGFVLSKPNDLSRYKDNTLGIENVVNTEFNNTTGLTLVDSTVSGGKLNCNTAGAFTTLCRQTSILPITAGRIRVMFVVSNYVSGSVYIGYGGNMTTSVRSANGVFIEDLTVTTVSNNLIDIKSFSSGFVGSIDMISIKPLYGIIFASNMIPRGTTLTDISGNGNNGVVSNCVQNRSGLMFNGVNSLVKGNAFSLTGDVSISCRVLLKTMTDPGNGVVFSTKISATNYMLVGFCGLELGAHSYINSAVRKKTSGAGILLNKWYTLTYTLTGSTFMCYINGGSALAINTNQSDYSGGETGKYNIGWNVSTYYSNIEIADIRIHNRLLTASEIKAYHNSFILPTFNEDFSTYPIGTLN